MQSFPENPEALSRRILKPVIIPGQCASMFAPPFRGNTLRTLGHDDGVTDLSPDKLCRCGIRYFKSCIDTFGRLKQPDGALRRVFTSLRRIPFNSISMPCMSGRFERNGAFGNVCVNRNWPQDASITEPYRKPVDKGIDFTCFLRPVVEAFLCCLGPFDTYSSQSDKVETIARIKGIIEGGEPLFQQSQERLRFCDWPSSLNADTPHISVCPKETGFDFPCPFYLLLQAQEKVPGQGLQHKLDGLHGDEWFGHAALSHADRNDAAWRNRLVLPAEHCIEIVDEPVSKAGRERCPGQNIHITNTAQSGALQAGKVVLFNGKADEREGIKPALLFLPVHHPALRMPGQGPGSCGIRCKSASDDHAMLVQPFMYVFNERGFISKKMDAPGHIENEAMRLIEGDKRSVAVTPVGQSFKQGFVFARRSESDIQMVELGSRIGQCKAPVQTCLCSPFIDGRQSKGICNLVHDNQVLVSMAALGIFAFEAIGGQVWKPQRQKQGGAV